MRIGLAQIGSKLPLVRSVLRHGRFLQVLIKQFFQNRIGKGVGGTVQLMPGNLRSGHQGRALGNVVHPGKKRFGLADRFCPDHVHKLGFRLDHIGGNAAGIGNGIVDGTLGLHVLPQELDTHVHHLRAVQSGTAVPRVACRVGSGARELVNHLQTGRIGAGRHLVGVAGMPGDGSVQVLEQSVSCHKGFAGAALLTGAAVENDRTLEGSFRNRFLDGDGGAQAGGTQQVMSAALAAAVGYQRLFLRDTSLLRKPGQCIKLAQDADAGSSGAEAAGKRGGNAAQLCFHQEAFRLQNLRIGFRGLVFQHRKLRIVPNLITESQNSGGFVVNTGIEYLFIHNYSTFPRKSWRRGWMG